MKILIFSVLVVLSSCSHAQLTQSTFEPQYDRESFLVGCFAGIHAFTRAKKIEEAIMDFCVQMEAQIQYNLLMKTLGQPSSNEQIDLKGGP